MRSLYKTAMNAIAAPQPPADLHIVLTHEAWVIVRSATATWRDFQEAFADFTTSLGPMGLDELLETFEAEWPEVLERYADDIRKFSATAREGQSLAIS
jgi:hypothetical protein